MAGQLDTRSRPADIAPGAYRWRESFQINVDGKTCRRAGHTRSFADLLFDNNGIPLSNPGHGAGSIYHNFDHHHQGATREPIIFGYESTDSTGKRRLFDGTQSRLSLLNEATGYWTDIATGKGAPGSYWTADTLQDVIVFTNNVNNVLAYDIGSAIMAEIPDLRDVVKCTAARVAIEFQGVVVLMNTFENGARFSSRIRWSDLNLPLSWAVGALNSVAGKQDLDYGDEILAAIQLLNSVYIFTRRAIWKMTATSQQVLGVATDFTFTKVYTERKNQAKCLTYPRTLISTGAELVYAGRDSFYRYSPFLAEPERPDETTTDWLYKATGVIYRKADTALSGQLCNAPVAEYLPYTKEYWFSWPSGSNKLNNWTLVSQLEQKSADIVRDGFSMLVNYRRTPTALNCNEVQQLIGASTRDYALKDLGTAFLKEYLQLVSNDPTNDLPLNSPTAKYLTVGYESILRGVIPTGLYDRKKIVNSVLIDDDTSAQDVPAAIRCRIGASRNVRDPNDLDPKCSVMWFDQGLRLLACQDEDTIAKLQSKNQQPSGTTSWQPYVEAFFLFFEFVVVNQDGTPAIGGDTCLSRIDFEIFPRQKPNRS